MSVSLFFGGLAITVLTLRTEDNKNETIDFLHSLGIYPKIKNGYYYPYSNLSSSIKEALLKEASIKGVKVRTDYLLVLQSHH